MVLVVVSDVESDAVEVPENVAQWLVEHPLPDHIPDMDVNMSEVATVFSVSTNTVKSWLTDPLDPMPCVEKGSNGREYVLRLSWCWAWRQKREAVEAERAGKLALLQSSLFNGSVDDANAGLSSKQIKETAEAALTHAKAARERGRLAQMNDVYQLLERLMVLFRNGALGMPDRLERELGLSPAQTRQVERAMEELLSGLQIEIEDDVLGHAFEANFEMDPQLVNMS